jgi:hypothetical protein
MLSQVNLGLGNAAAVFQDRLSTPRYAAGRRIKPGFDGLTTTMVGFG